MKRMKFLVIALACLMVVPAFAEEEPLEFTGYDLFGFKLCTQW